MKIVKCIAIAFVLVLTSFFEFPFYFTFLPQVNTKMMLAVGGLIFFFVNLARTGKSSIDVDLAAIVGLSILVSLASFVSITINNTPDDSYLTYFVSMCVWVGAGYFVVNAVRCVHGYVSLDLLCRYLIGVGVLQCLLSLLIDNITEVKLFVDSFLAGEGYMGKNESRLYGVGCALDVAGSRFSALLVMSAVLIVEAFRIGRDKLFTFYITLSFIVIAVVGNMIGRTTSVGLLLSIAVLLYYCLFSNALGRESRNSLAKWLVTSILVGTVIFTVLYLTMPSFQENFRFGFEGFFNLIEKGKWEVSSNEQLKAQYVFPDNLKSWIVGEGYMASTDNDPYYIGVRYPDFYRYTDVGYCRFIFYFGVLGLACFSAFMIKVGTTCVKHFVEYKVMFLLMLLVNFIVWFKVSTDIFVMFAVFLCFQQDEIQCNSSHPLP